MRAIQQPKIEEVALSEVMYALSDPVRLEIVRQLATTNRPMTCGELVMGRPKSSMSHHFRILREAGLVKTVVDGKEHFNSLRSTDMEKHFPGVLKAVLKVICK